VAEQIILDPSEVSNNRTALDITPWIRTEGIDWGNAEIQAYMAEQTRGEVPVDFRVPNREIQLPFRFSGTLGGTTTTTARANIQAKLSLFQQEGGWIKRVTNSGGTVYADVVSASFAATSVSGWESRQNADVDAEGTLECIPDFYGDEVTLSDHTETTNPELVFTETDIDGDYPARVRLVVDDDSGNDQRGMFGCFRSRNYSSASTARLVYEAEALGLLDTAATAALSGASGGTVVTHGTLSTNWTPVLSTNIGGTAYLTHTGTYRWRARVYSTSGTAVQVRGVWDTGDLVNPVENNAQITRLPGASNFYIVDLGEVRLDPAPVGTHRWLGYIQGKGDAGGENLSVDRMWFECGDEAAWQLTAPIPTGQGLVAPSARSEFNTESGAITGDALQIGGNWTVVTNSDTDDFSVSAGVATRTATSDSGAGIDVITGRGVTAGTTSYTGISQSVNFKWSALVQNVGSSLLARVTDSSNYFYAEILRTLSGSSIVNKLNVVQVVSGTPTTLFSKIVSGVNAGAWLTLSLNVLSTGQWTVSVIRLGSGSSVTSSLASASGSSTTLATGGTLQTGKIGIGDRNSSATACTRSYDSYTASVPPTDAVTFASRSVQLTTQGHYRLDSGGTAYGPVSVQNGDLPRLPQSSLESRTIEGMVKMSRGDLDQIPDSGIDDISARLYYRPSYLFVP